MDVERKFNDLGVDAITGVQLMRSLGIYPDDFIDDIRFMRFKDIIDYFKNIPDRDYLLNKMLIGKNVDRLDHVWGYVELAKQKEKIKQYLEIENKKLDAINSLGDENDMLLQREIVDNYKIELSKLDEQIYYYE